MTGRINYQAPKPSFDMGRVMSRTFAGVFKNIKRILLAIVIVIMVSTLVSIPMFLLDSNSSDTTAGGAVYRTATIAYSATWIFFAMFLCVFTDHLAFAQFTNRPAGFRFVFLRSLKLTAPILLIVVLYFIASYIGMIFLIVPGVIISVGWAVIGPAYLHEDTSLFGSFGRSWALTRGYKWWVWLATIIMSIIATFMLFMVSILMAVISIPGLSVDSDSQNPSGGGLIFLLLSSVIVMYICIYLFAALYASFTTALYTELRELKEGPLTERMSAVFD